MFIKKQYPELSVIYDDSNFKFLGVRCSHATDMLHVDASKTITMTVEPSSRRLSRRKDPSSRGVEFSFYIFNFNDHEQRRSSTPQG